VPLFSAFTPLGMLRLSGGPSHAERIFKSKRAALAKEFDLSKGSRYDAWCYAEAMREARILYSAERAGRQALPHGADVMLPKLERDLGLAPGPTASLAERRQLAAFRRRQPRPPTRYEVESSLRGLLGDDFLALVPTGVDDAAVYPADVGTSPANLVSPRVARRYIRLLEPVAFVSTPVQVAYEHLIPTGTPADAVQKGERLVVEPEVQGITERVTVTAVDDELQILLATFTRPHTAGCLATTMPFPTQQSTKRRSLVVLTPAAAVDPERRRVVNEYMARVCRATSCWDIAQGSGGTTGAFTVGVSPIAAETIAAVSYT
jgi:hypothetical protein